MKIPLCDLQVPAQAKAYVNDALDTNWIGGAGEYLTKLGVELCYVTGRPFAIPCANGTLALEVALMALGVGPGDEVIVPALTFVSPAAAVCRVGATPVFADVHPETWTLDPLQLDGLITIKTRAIIAVDLLGHVADYALLYKAAKGVPIIEDAAEAHGAAGRYLQAGAWGDIATFSFHANKTIPAGEGGAVLCDNPLLAGKLKRIVNHGMTAERPYHHEMVGTNARMTNLTAALLLAQVERWDELVEARQNVASAYDALLAGRISRRSVAKWATEACWLYTVYHPERDRLVKALRDAGIDARAIWPALPDNPAYQRYNLDGYPVARRVAAEAFWLPTWAGMPQETIEEVATALLEALAEVEGVKA